MVHSIHSKVLEQREGTSLIRMCSLQLPAGISAGEIREILTFSLPLWLLSQFLLGCHWISEKGGRKGEDSLFNFILSFLSLLGSYWHMDRLKGFWFCSLLITFVVCVWECTCVWALNSPHCTKPLFVDSQCALRLRGDWRTQVHPGCCQATQETSA